MVMLSQPHRRCKSNVEQQSEKLDSLDRKYTKKEKRYRKTSIVPPLLFLSLLWYVSIPANSSLKLRGNVKQSSTKTTIVLMGHTTKRFQNYKTIFATYGEMSSVIDKVLFLWNSVNDSPPSPPANTKVPILPLPQKKNSMNNRFGPDVLKYAETDVITVVDDDVVLSEQLLYSMLTAWAEAGDGPKPIVGTTLDARIVGAGLDYHHPCNKFDGWFTQADCWKALLYPWSPMWSRPLNLVVGKTMTLSKKHVHTYMNDTKITGYVDDGHFCEDILMNAVVRNVTGGHEPILVQLGTDGQRKTLVDDGGLSKKGIPLFNWHPKRTECVRWAESHFGPSAWN
mmetsp:Transcript_26684/g.37606  ORF Transcript_26684/g.37606 Transcript_26684/m.37606 type:complete len:339 (-) Transcript_26684:187-1203(-)